MKEVITNDQDNDFDPDSMLPEKEVESLDINVNTKEEQIDTNTAIKVIFAIVRSGCTYVEFIETDFLQYKFESRSMPNYEFLISVNQENLLKLVTCLSITQIMLRYSNDINTTEDSLRSKNEPRLSIQSCQTIKKLGDRYILKLCV